MPTGEDPSAPKIRVAVLSTSVITRIGVRGLLATVPSRVTVIADTQTDHVLPADVIVLDVAVLNDPEHHLAVGRAIQRSDAVVAIAAGFHTELPTHLRGLGVETCVSPDISGPDLVATIEAAALGPGAARTRRVPGLCRGTEASFGAGLSTREHHVITKIAEGLSNQAIAEDLFLSINSVKSYIRSSYRKIGVQTRSEAVIWAFHEGIAYTPVEAGRPRAVGS